MSQAVNPAVERKAEQVDWAGKNYLVVDDFIGVRQLLRESLRSLGARNIDQASSGGEAIGLLEQVDKRAFIDSFRKVEHWFGDYAKRFQQESRALLRQANDSRQ